MCPFSAKQNPKEFDDVVDCRLLMFSLLIGHLPHVLSAGYPDRVVMLLLEGAQMQSMATLGGIR